MLRWFDRVMMRGGLEAMRVAIEINVKGMMGRRNPK